MSRVEFETSTPKTTEDEAVKVPVFNDETLAAVKEGIGRIVPIPWPANPRVWVGMRCLSRGEDRKCYLGAVLILEQIKRPNDSGLLARTMTDLILQTALRDCIWIEDDDGTLREQRMNPADSLVRTPDLFAEFTTEKQVEKLSAHYDDIMQISAPLTRFQKMIQGDEFQKAWDELKKKPDANHLIGSSYKELIALLSFIAHLFADPPVNSAT